MKPKQKIQKQIRNLNKNSKTNSKSKQKNLKTNSKSKQNLKNNEQI
jgi:hypothetical protein